jgi:hypothetical protein
MVSGSFTANINRGVCQTEEDMSLLMSSVYSCCMYWWEEGEKRAGVGARWGDLKWGSWLWATGQVGWGFTTTHKEPPFEVRGVFYTYNIMCNIVKCVSSMKRKLSLLCRLKINHMTEEQNMHLFLVAVANNYAAAASWKLMFFQYLRVNSIMLMKLSLPFLANRRILYTLCKIHSINR